MKVAKHNSGLVIGAVFSAGSLGLTLTFIIPIVSVIPGVIFETIASNLVDNTPYSNVGRLTIQLLLVAFILALILCIISIISKIEKFGQVSQRRIIGMMMILYFIVHSLGFYIYWGLELHFRSDGQLIFAAVESFPFSSLAFIIIGLIIDFVKNTALANYLRHKK